MTTKTKQQNISDGWTQVKLGDLGVIGDGNHSAKYPTANEMIESGVPFIRATNIINGRVVDNGLRYISPQKHFELKKGHLKTNDIIIVNRGQIGVVGLVTENFNNSNLNSQLAWFRADDENYKYIYYYLNTHKAKSFFDSNQSGGALQQLPIKTLKELPIFLPNKAIRLNIVKVLETWDSAIEKLKQKIEIKKEIKKGLMQELLTGDTRLPGFKYEWKTYTLSDLGTFSKGAGILKDQVIDTGINTIRYGELYTKYDYQIKQVHSHIPSSVVKTTRKIERGDILFAGSGETIDEIGKSAVYLLDEECYAGGDIVIFTPKKSDSLFLSYFLNVGESRKKMREVGQGQSVVHIYKRDLEKMKLHIPEIEEQKEIAKILTFVFFEIDQLTQKLNLLKDQKKYLLNNLITGEIRTPENLLEKVK